MLIRSKILLGISFSLQLISRLLLMVPTAILALPSVIDADINQHDNRVVEWDIRDKVTVKIVTPFLNTRSERSIGERI